MAGERNLNGKRGHYRSDHSENGGYKRRNPGDDRDSFAIGSDDTVYRYLCPALKIGSIIGRGGEIVKQLRADTNSKIRICETVPGSEYRVVTIYSTSDETNASDEMDAHICPAQDALFRVHDRVIAEDFSGDGDGQQVSARLLVPSDQIGCIIGKGGQIVQSIRTDTGAQIRILKDEHLPACALRSDELVQISGEASLVRKALYQISSRLHDNPSRTQHSLASSAPPSIYTSGGSLIGPSNGAPIMGFAPLASQYGGYRHESGERPRSSYSSRDESTLKEFSLRIICPTGNIGGVIGKGGAIINQIRQETRASIKVDSTRAEGDDCLIAISSKEHFEDQLSPTIEAARCLQPRCSEKIERDSGIISFTTRLLVPSSRIGCLIGKGGAIVTEMRKVTNANIRILSKENLPKVAGDDDEMVQISGEMDVCEAALLNITTRLRANLFEKEGALLLPMVPYVHVPAGVSNGISYDDRDSRRYGRGYSSVYGGASDFPTADTYSSYSSLQSPAGASGYGVYGGYSSARGSSSGFSGQASAPRRKSYY